MCGISGFWRNLPLEQDQARAVITKMTTALSHRGPDGEAVWVDSRGDIALGHRRLSIIDLSPAGAQPMLSPSGRYVTVFNGEIYNHMALRAELTQARWRGHSDTETLLAAIEHWGLEAALHRLNGMFAFALWDQRERRLHLARDRFGEKPLYYGWAGNGEKLSFIFASEIKSLRKFSYFRPEVCRQALADYLRFNYVPEPRSIYQNIFKLPPGCLLSIHRPLTTAPNQPPSPECRQDGFSLKRWYDLKDTAQTGIAHAFTSQAEALQSLEERLHEAVLDQSVADVPLGAFLSGGVDSSTIAALMQRQAQRAGSPPIETFTIGFDEAGFDESPHALAVARHLGTRHHAMRVSAVDALDIIPRLPTIYDEPFGDSSQIPTHLLCLAARQHVTVALSGDGGDELFGGYNRYFWGPRIWNKVAWLPQPARQMLGRLAQTLPIGPLNQLGRLSGVNHLGDKVHKLAYRLRTVRSLDELYASLVQEWPDPAQLVLGLKEPGTEQFASLSQNLPPGLDRPGTAASQQRMMLTDAITYLPGDILCKVDRAAMACGLETRAPFLDHRVAEAAWRLPLAMKIRGNTSKWALRQILYRHVPKHLIERPKAGFAVPIGQWLRGPLRDWAEDMLSEQRLEQQGYFRAAPIRQALMDHQSGRRDHTARLWGVLMFQMWLDSQMDNRG